MHVIIFGLGFMGAIYLLVYLNNPQGHTVAVRRLKPPIQGDYLPSCFK